MSQLKGGGGKPKTPPSPTNTPDNLRSEDILEAIFGVTEGPWKGLTNGHKSFMVGDTVLQRQDGDYNFEDFEVITYPGTAFPDILKYRLGGESNNFSVNVPTAFGVPLTRQTAHGNIDFIDIRMAVSQLYQSVENGKNPGTFDNTFQFRIRYKPASSSTWAEWGDAAGMNTNNPYFTQYDSDWSDGTVYNPSTGEYTDISGSNFKVWNVAKFNQAVDYWQSQPSYTPASNILSIRGKTTSTYIKEYRIPVQRIPEPYQIQIERISADSSLSGDPKYIAEVAWESFQTIDVELKRYPYTGFIQIVGKATDQFSSIPQFSGEGDGIIVKVPTNYNPYTRTYTGTWDGNFKEEWTNNPVWILYEAMHNDRWGWSAYSPVKWSRYEAYELAQICDFKLPNGRPRYTFNAYITDPMDGREFCRYIAGSFNSVIVDDDNGTVQVLMDKDDAAIQLYGPESIIGDFEYTYTDVNTRFNDLTVVFRNPDIDYAEDRRRVFDQAHIDQHGRIPYDFVAVGTTNDNEAVRKASRRLVSATTETEQVNFKTNRKASYLKPYDVILITDPIKGYGLSGRFKSYATTVATLRDPVYLEAGVSYGVDVQTDTGVVSLTLANVSTSGFTSTLTFTNPIPNTLDQKAQFSLKDANSLGLPKPYRVLDVSPEDEEQDQWAVFAIEINRNKFAAEDNAEIVGEPVYTSVKKKEPSLPTNPRAVNATRAAPDGTMLYKARVDFTPPADPYVTEYWVRYRQVGQIEYTVLPVDGTGIEIDLPRDGSWEFQVQSRNIWEQQSPWLATNPTSVVIDKPNGITGGSITSIAGDFNQIRVTVAFPAQTDIRYARLYASQTNNSGTANMVVRGDTQNLVHTNLLPNATWYYWVRFEDNLGNIGPFTSAAGAGVSATTRLLGAGDIADGSIGSNKFVPGFTGVENVNSLPTTGNYEGRMVLLSTDNKLYTYKNGAWVSVVPDITGEGIEKVDTLPTGLGMADQGRVVFLKSDNKIYRWTGTAWTSQTSATDVTGFLQESNFPSNLRPVESVTVLPGAPHVEGRIVYLTTDDKLYRNTGSGWTSATSTSDLTGTLGSNLFSNSLRPPEVVTSLPTSGNFQGKTVILTTDNKLYRWTGSAWIKNVDTSDLSGTLDSSLFSNTLRPPEVVTSLPASGNFVGKLVFLTTDNKLYRWTGSAWTKNVDTGDLSGTISDTQLAGMSAAKLIGQLSDSQIANIAAAKIAGQLSDSQIANLAAAKIAGQLSASQLQGIEAAKLLGTVAGTQIAANTITGGNIFGGTITGDKIAGRTITGGNIVGQSITGFEIVGDTITGTHIKGSTITGGNIVGGTITGDKIAANTITAANLTAGIITAGYIASKAITVDKLAVGSTDNLITNGQFQSENGGDLPLAWSRFTKPNASDIIRVTRDDSNTWPVKKALELNRQVAGSGELSAWADSLTFDSADYWEQGNLLAQPGDEFYVESQVFSSQGGIARIEVIGRRANGTLATSGSFVLEGSAYSSVSNNHVTINTSGWLKSVWTFKYTGTAQAKIGLRFHNVGTSVGQYALFGNIIMRRRNTGMLLVDGAITARNISAATITGDKIVGGTITGGHIAGNTITGDKIVGGTITGGHIAANTITAGNIAGNTITGDKIVAGTITGGLIAAQTIRTNNMHIGAFSLNPDPQFNDGAFWIPDSNGWFFENGDNAVQMPNRRVSLWDGTAHGNSTARKHVYAGAEGLLRGLSASSWFRVKARFRNNSNQAVTVSVQIFDIANNHIGDIGVGAAAHSGVNVVESAPKQVPANAYWYRYVIYNDGGTPYSGAISVSDIELTQAANSNLVVDGSITATKIQAGSITADKLVAGSITSAYIAANTITAKNLAIGSFDNIIPDGDYRDHSFWKNTDVVTNFPNVTEANGAWTDARVLQFIGAGSHDVSSKYFTVEPGASYKVTYRVSTGDMTPGGWFQPLIHVPNYQWQSILKSGPAGQNVGAESVGDVGSNTGSYTGAGNDTGEQSYVFYNPYGVPDNANKRIQFRFLGNFTGAVYMQVKIVRVSDGTLIANGAITTGKIAAATITGDRIAANTITGGNIAANTITAGNISVANLAAINANLGTITTGLMQSSDGGTVFDLTNQRLMFTKSSYSFRQGVGIASTVLMWYGPSSVAVGSETRTNGVWSFGTDGKVYYGAAELTSTGLTVTANRNVSNKTRSGAGTTSSDAYTLTVTGGSGNYSYQWGYFAGDTGATCSAPTSATMSLSQTVGVGQSKGTVWMCLISDLTTMKSTTFTARYVLTETS